MTLFISSLIFQIFLNVFWISSIDGCGLRSTNLQARKVQLHECGCSSTLPFISKQEVTQKWAESASFLENTTFYPMNFQITNCTEFRISCSDPNDHYLHFDTVHNYGAVFPFMIQYNYTMFLATCNQTTQHWSEANNNNVDIEKSYAYACVKNF